MPLTKKGSKIMSSMRKTYGSKRAKRIFYASKNAGKISGVDRGFFGHYSIPSNRPRPIKTTVGVRKLG